MKSLLKMSIAIGFTCAVAAMAQTTQPTPMLAAPNAVPGAVLAQKRPGVTRIGIVQPRMDMGTGAASAAEPLRVLLGQYLTGPNVEIVPLSSMLPIQAEAEGKQKECDYILYASLTQKKGGGMGFLRGAQSMASMVPVLGMAGRTGSIVGQAAATTAISAANQVASGVKAKSEVTFDCQLSKPGSSDPLVSNNQKTKAQSDGQDVITPMVEHAATAITAAILKK